MCFAIKAGIWTEKAETVPILDKNKIPQQGVLLPGVPCQGIQLCGAVDLH